MPTRAWARRAITHSCTWSSPKHPRLVFKCFLGFKQKPCGIGFTTDSPKTVWLRLVRTGNRVRSVQQGGIKPLN
eukprot:12151020-Alexandrium_andersonii.AAC.1